MPDPKLAKPWHGVPREEIDWWPTVNEDVCIGCGMCVVGCGRQVYRFDFERKKAIVDEPMNCMVGCTTCLVSCPTSAISFPPTDVVLQLADRPEVRHSIEDALIARREELVFGDLLPDSEHLVQMEIRSMTDVSDGTRLMTIAPHRTQDCMCQFTPGQYLEIWIPGTEWMSRAYSIGNAPHEDGSVELHLRRVEGGRFSEWAFGGAQVGDVLTTRGPIGAFTMRSPGDRPLVFVARGTGFAPIKAILEQQLQMFPERPMVLFWGVTGSEDFYAVDELGEWLRQDPNLRMTLVARRFDGFQAPDRAVTVEGRVSDAVASSALDLAGYDAYVAGPRHTVVDVVAALQQRGVGAGADVRGLLRGLSGDGEAGPRAEPPATHGPLVHLVVVRGRAPLCARPVSEETRVSTKEELPWSSPRRTRKRWHTPSAGSRAGFGSSCSPTTECRETAVPSARRAWP